jgi:hypothetical protein
MVKGVSPTLKTPPGPYPLVVTAEFRRTADSWQMEGPAGCIPLVSSTGHGDAALHRVHYQDGRFALANLLVALLPRDPQACDARYLYHLLMTRKDERLVPLMQGTANVSLKEQDIAGVEIPLPPLTEQRRLVARIEAVAAQIQEARELRRQAAAEAEALLRALMVHDLEARPTPMRELVTPRPLDVVVRKDESYPFAGVYCFGRGVFRIRAEVGGGLRLYPPHAPPRGRFRVPEADGVGRRTWRRATRVRWLCCFARVPRVPGG